jgi:hypothetical protein
MRPFFEQMPADPYRQHLLSFAFSSMAGLMSNLPKEEIDQVSQSIDSCIPKTWQFEDYLNILRFKLVTGLIYDLDPTSSQEAARQATGQVQPRKANTRKGKGKSKRGKKNSKANG